MLMFLSKPRRTAAGLLFALLATAGAAASDTAFKGGPFTTPQGLRAQQVWTDDLPGPLAASDIEVAVLQPDATCNPPKVRGLFLQMVQVIDPDTRMLCEQVAKFITAPPVELPLTTRLVTQDFTHRAPLQMVRELATPAQRRYVVLLQWNYRVSSPGFDFSVEAAVVDRERMQVVWHGARSHDLTRSSKYFVETFGNILRGVLQHEIPRDLMQRTWWETDVPLAGSRWIPLRDMSTWRPGEQAGLWIVNTYSKGYKDYDQRAPSLWPRGEARIPEERGGDPSTRTVKRRAQTVPLMPANTQALLALPPGDYQLQVYTDTAPLQLAPGEIKVLHIHLGWLGNTPVHTLEPESWVRDPKLQQRLRHAWFAEPLTQGYPEPMVPYFLSDAPPLAAKPAPERSTKKVETGS